MDCVLFERDGAKFLVIEDSYTRECWTLLMHRYTYLFSEGRPLFKELARTRSRYVEDKEAISLLEKYDNNSVHSGNIHELIERLKVMPF